MFYLLCYSAQGRTPRALKLTCLDYHQGFKNISRTIPQSTLIYSFQGRSEFMMQETT